MIKALDRKGRSFVLEAKDGTLLARCIQHEYDHLDGVLFVDHAIDKFEVEEQLSKNNLPPLEINRILEEKELDEEINKLLEKIDTKNENE